MAPHQDNDFILPALMTTYIADWSPEGTRRNDKPAPQPIADPDEIPDYAYDALAGSFRPDMRKSPHDNPFSFI